MPIKPVVPNRPQDELILEDKELVYIIPFDQNNTHEGINHCIVAGCIRSVGITLVDSKDTKKEIFCLNKSDKNMVWFKFTDYDTIFNAVQDGIINGRIDHNELLNLLGVVEGPGGQSSCGFK